MEDLFTIAQNERTEEHHVFRSNNDPEVDRYEYYLDEPLCGIDNFEESEDDFINEENGLTAEEIREKTADMANKEYKICGNCMQVLYGDDFDENDFDEELS